MLHYAHLIHEVSAMNITNLTYRWDRMTGNREGCGHHSTCFAKVVSLRKFRRLSDRPWAKVRRSDDVDR